MAGRRASYSNAAPAVVAGAALYALYYRGYFTTTLCALPSILTM